MNGKWLGVSKRVILASALVAFSVALAILSVRREPERPQFLRYAAGTQPTLTFRLLPDSERAEATEAASIAQDLVADEYRGREVWPDPAHVREQESDWCVVFRQKQQVWLWHGKEVTVDTRHNTVYVSVAKNDLSCSFPFLSR